MRRLRQGECCLGLFQGSHIGLLVEDKQPVTLFHSCTVFERLALVARGGLRDALSLLDQLSAFAVGEIDMTVARAALSLPSIEAVRGVVDGMTRRDPGAVMAFIADAAEGGADLRLFAEELVVHLRALLLLRSGADARLSNELPEDEVAWLRERAPAWSAGTLMRLVQTLSEALARTRDAAQFQVQTEVALLTACDVETLAPAALAARPPSEVVSSGRDSTVPVIVDIPAPAAAVAEVPAPAAAMAEVPAPAAAVAEVPAPAPSVVGDQALKARWPDVIEQVKRRNGLVGSILGSAEPLSLDDSSVLVVAFSTEFNRKTAEKATNRQLIETAFERVYGSAYRLRATVPAGSDGPGLLEDPVINYAARTFGGQPRRVD